MDDQQALERAGHIEQLLERLEAVDGEANELATETVAAMLELYGEGLARIMEAVEAASPALVRSLAADELVSHLLVLHGLHPVDVRTRVRSALAEVRPYLESHGGGVELLDVEDGVVRLRLEGSCSGCASSRVTLKLAVEEAIHKAAPEIEAVEAAGVDESPDGGLLQIEISGEVGGRAPEGAWTVAGALAQLDGGGSLTRRVAGEDLLFVRARGELYAYRPVCAACGGKLEEAPVRDTTLTCPACEAAFDVRHAGRSLDASGRHLDPVPLLVDDGGMVRVAVRSAVA